MIHIVASCFRCTRCRWWNSLKVVEYQKRSSSTRTRNLQHTASLADTGFIFDGATDGGVARGASIFDGSYNTVKKSTQKEGIAFSPKNCYSRVIDVDLDLDCNWLFVPFQSILSVCLRQSSPRRPRKRRSRPPKPSFRRTNLFLRLLFSRFSLLGQIFIQSENRFSHGIVGPLLLRKTKRDTPLIPRIFLVFVNGPISTGGCRRSRTFDWRRASVDFDWFVRRCSWSSRTRTSRCWWHGRWIDFDSHWWTRSGCRAGMHQINGHFLPVQHGVSKFGLPLLDQRRWSCIRGENTILPLRVDTWKYAERWTVFLRCYWPMDVH